MTVLADAEQHHIEQGRRVEPRDVAKIAQRLLVGGGSLLWRKAFVGTAWILPGGTGAPESNAACIMPKLLSGWLCGTKRSSPQNQCTRDHGNRAARAGSASRS